MNNDEMTRQYKQYTRKMREGDHHEETATNNSYVVANMWNVF